MVPAPSDATATMPLSQDEQNSSIIQQGVKPKELHSGNVVLLDGRKLDFQVSKNAEGEILFNLVTDAIGLIEKDYFSLAFYENGSVRKWLYKNKKIQKQVKDLPWDFSLEVKFYTPDPSQLADDFTRHLLTLQLRTDIYNGKLPASLVNQAHLGSLIAQAELGDYSPEKTYDELESKIIQLYKDQKGKTPPEAELSFLMACRELTLYGMVMFSAKHNGKPVRVGINSAGISVFQEHLRQNYVVWQGMHQLEYQRKSFTIKLKHGEKEGKSSLTFKLDTEPLAKLCWRTAVEHHTFFRLMQPEDKTNKGGFFQLGSGRFRPEGRTHFQTKMASQMFDGTPTAGPQISSAQIVSRSSENLPAANQGSSPVHYADDKSMEGSSPQKRYTITSHMETNSPRTSTLDRSLEVGTVSDSGIENAKSLDSPLYVSTTTQVTAKTTTIPRFGRYTVTETPSPRFLRAEETLPPPTQPEVWPDENVRPGRPTVSTPTLLSAQWFSRQRHPPPLITRTHASATRNSPPTPSRTSISVPPKFLSQHFSSEKRDTVTESSRYTTKIPARSLSAAPYAQLIAMSPNGDQMLPIVRELNESVHTTLMNLPYRSHTVLAEYISSPASSQISTELLSTYRSLLSSAGHSPEEIDYRVKEATISRVYCRRSHLSPKTPYSPLPANAEEAIRTRTPSPNVQFDDTINHCVRIIGMDNTVPLYQYNVSAAEAQRAVQRGAISPSRKQYQSLTREEQVIETPKSRFSFPRRKKHIPRRNIFERNEFQPVVAISRTKELPQAPVRYFSDVYHSGYNLQDRKVIRRKIHEGDESEGSISDLRNYGFSKENAGQVNRLEKSGDLDSCNIREHVLKRSYPKSKGMSRFPKPVAVLHLQRQRRPSHGHTNGFAQVDLSPIPIPPSRLTPQYPEKSGVYTGKLEPLRHSEIVSKPLRSDVSVYHSGQSEPSRNRRFKFFTWARHEGEEEVGDKDPTGYKFDHSPYEGPLDDVNKVNDLDTLPLASYVTKYHEGKTVLKEDEEEIEEPHDKQTAIIHLRSKEDEPQVEEELKPAKAPKQPKEKKPKKEKKDKDQESSFFGFLKSKDRKAHEEVGHVSTPSTSSYPLIGERYEGPLDEVDKQRELDSQPLRSDVSVYHSGQSEPSRNRRFKFFTWARHEGEEEVGDKDPTGYKFDHSPYEGPLDDVNKVNDLDTLPLASYVTKYHEGKTVLKEDEEEIEEPHDKQTAIIHLRSKEDEPQVEEELKPAKAPKQPKEKKPKKEKKDKDQESSFFGFLKSKDRKAHEEVGHVSTPSTSSYPLIGERYEGPLDEVDKQRELDSQPLRSDVSVYHSGQSEPSRNRRFKFFTWARHEGEEEVGDKDPTGYKFDHSPYEGPLDDVNKVNDLDTLPLASYVTKYHEGKTVLKEDEEEIEEPHDKQTAIIHLRSKEDEPQVEEELKPAKAPKQPKEKKPKKEKKDKDQESSFFGFLKSKDRKAHEEVGHVSTPSTSSYPLIGERYEGPLDEVDKQRELDSQPLRSDVSVYHSGQSEPSRNRRFKFFTWARHEGEEEVGDKDPTGYKFDHSPYEGPLDDVNKVNDLDTLPLASYVTKYHEGKTVLKDEEEIEEPHDEQTAIIHLRSKEDEPQVEEELKPAKAPKQPKEKKPKKEKKDKDQESSFFGFLKSKDRKAHEEVGHVSTPSTSSYPLIGELYEGPLDEVDKQRELDSQPLRSDVSVYHSGQSEPSRNRRFKFFTWARHEGEEEVGDKDPTGYKFDHSPYEGPLDDVNKVNDLDTLPLASYVTKYHEGKTVLKEDEEEIEEPHDKQTAIIHLRSKEDEPQVEEELKPAKAPKQPKEKKPKKEKKDKDQESSFFGFLKSKDRKAHEEVGHVSTPSTSSYPLIGERYEGPLDEVDKQRELDSQPLRSDVSVYHSGQSEPSRNRRFKFFTWARHEGEEEVGDKDPTGYKFDHSPYEGPLDDVNKVNDLDTLPLASYVTKYHEGKTVLKEDEEEIEEPHDKQTAIIHLRSKEDEPQVEEELKPAKAPKQPKEKKPKKEKKDKDQESSFFGFLKSKDRKAHEEVGHVSTPSTSSYPLIGERYEGPLDEVDKQRELDSQPLRSDVSVYHSGQSEPSRNRRFKFFTWARHEGEEEVGDKDPTGYKFDHSPYEGPLDDVNKVNDLDTLPLASYVTKYHEGKTVLKEDEEEIEEPHDKQTAIIHLRSKEDEPQVEEELKPAKAPKQPKEKKPKKEKKDKDQESSFFGFLKSKDRKAHEEVGHVSTPSTSSYPLIGERYEGPLDEVDKQRELDSQPLRSDVSVYHSGQSEPSRNRRFKFFTWARHEGEEEVGDKDPTGYKFDHSPYEGPLDDVNKVNDLDTLPLASYVTKYHEGKTVLKEDEEEIEEPHDKQTAIIHLRSKEDEPQVEEELKPAKAPKQPKEKKPKKEKKDKDQESSFFGFLKSKDRKAHEEVGHVSTPSTSSYPLIGERYEGPLDEVDKQRELDSQPLRSDVSVYHSGQSEPSRNRRFKFFTWARHEGEEEVGDKDPTGYKFDHSPYEDTLPLASYVTKYHEGKTVLKEDEEEIEEPHDKQTAIIHLRSKEDEPQVEEELKPAKAPKQPKEKKPKKEKKDKDQESSFFGFLKSKDRKAHEEVGHVSTPSTSSYPLIGERYEGPLDEVDKQRELDSQPLRSDVSVYHSGQSEPSRNRRFKFFTWARHEGEEEVGDKDPTGYKFDHSPYEGPLDDVNKVNDLDTLPLASYVTKYHEGKTVLKEDEEEIEEPHDKQTAIIHLRSKEDEPQVEEELKPAKAPKQPKEKKPKKEKKDKDQESSFFGFLKSKDRKAHEEVGHVSTPSTSSYPLIGERYEGPLDEVDKQRELDSQPLRSDVSVYHSGQSEPSRNRRFKFFTWARHEGEEEVGDKDPTGYKFDHSPYEGPLDDVNKVNDLDTLPLASYVTKYHEGKTVLKEDEEEIEEPHDKQTAIIHLRSKEDEPQVEEELKPAKAPKQPKEKKPKKEKKDKDQESSFFGFLKSKDRKAHEEVGHVSTPSTSSYPLIGERYEGPLDEVDKQRELDSQPLRSDVSVYHSGQSEPSRNRRFKFFTWARHEGEEEVGDKDPTGYKFDHSPYEGPLDDVNKVNDLDTLPLASYVTKYHEGKTVLKEDEEEIEEPHDKQTAIIHLRSKEDEPQVEEELKPAKAPKQPKEKKPKKEKKDKDQESSFFGFLKSKDRKAHEEVGHVSTPSTSSYPLIGERYEGPLDEVDKQRELDSQPLRSDVSVYHSGQSEPSRNRRFKFFTWARHEGEEEVGDKDPTGYKFDHSPYEGPLDDVNKVNDLDTLPLASYVTKYHEGKTVLKEDEEEIEEPHDKQTAIIHLRSKEDEPQVEEELKPAKAPKQPKEKKPKKEKKDKDQESSFFGFLKSKDRKAHEEVGHVSTPSTSSYPLIGERYEGPLDEVDKQRELDSQPLRSDVSVYHSGQSEPSRNRRFKFFTWARHEGEEEVGDKDPTGYKFDHSPYEGPLDDVNKVNDLDTLPLASYVTKYHEGKTVLKEDEEEIEEPHDKQTAIIHLRSKEDEPQVEEELKPAKAPKQPKEKKPKKEKKDKDQESSFFGFLKSKDRKAHEEVGHVSTPSTSSYPLIGERYEGPLDEVDKQRELDSQPLRSDVSVYHSGQSEPSRNRRFKFFTWARHEGEEEVGDKDPTGYKFDHSPYEGPLDDVNKVNDLDTLPLASYVTKYHEGKTVLKEDEEEIEEPHDKQTAIIHLRSKEDEPQVEEELKPAKAPKQPKEKKPKKEKKDKDQESSFFGFLKSKDRKAHEEVGHVSTPSTSSYPLIGERYEGPLDEVDKQRELDSQPLRSDVSVYHSGQSEPSRNRRFKFFTWARHEGEEEVGDKDPTGYKFDHSPYEGPLDDVNKVNDLDTLPLASYVTKYHEGKTVLKEDEEEIEEPHDKQTAIIHLRSKEDEPQVEEELKPAKAPKQPKEKKPKKEKKDKDQESSFFGFLKSKDRKAHEEVGHVSTPSTSSYPLIGERYEGPLDEVDKQRELDSQPLRSDVSVYHSGQSEPSRNRRFKFFTWARHEGEEEVGDKDPTGYKFDHSPYEGPLDDVNKVNDLDTLPLASYVTKYHEGKTVLKEDEEEIEEPHDKQTAIIHLRSKEDEPQVEEELKPAKAPKQPKEKKPKKEKKDKDQESSFFGFLKSKDRKAHEEVGHVSTPSTSSYPLIGERYEGPLDEVDKQRELDSQPLRSDVSVYHSGQSEPSRNRRFKFFTWARHEGEEEVGDKDPTGYKFDHSPYEGPLDDVNKVNDLDTLPLASYVTKYHEGKTVLKEDEEEIEEPHDKQTAIIHLRSKEDEPQVEEELKPAKAPKQPKEKKPKKEKKDKDQESSFFGFLKSKDRKAHEEVGHVSTPSTSSYPLIGERYEGPLDEVDKQRELDSQPLRSDVSVYHSGQSEPSRNRRFKFFTWARHEGEEEVGDKDPTGYKFDHSPYEGPLDDVNKVNDLDTLPLASYVTKYHEGKTVLKEDEEEIEEPHDKQTAIIHLRSKEDEPQVEEELKPAKAPKQPKEKKPKKEKKDKDQESSFFGFLKSKDRKAHEEVGHVSTPSTSSYPLIGERYEGPLDEVDKQRELDSQPLRSDVSVYHSGQSEPSRNRRFKFFTWARHEGEEEVGDKDPTGYKFDHSPYEGPLDDVNKVNDLDTLPLASYVTKYHEGKTVLKEDEEEIEEPHDKQTAIIHLRSKEDEPQVEEELKPAKAPKQPKEKKPKKEKKDKDQESSFFGFLKSKDRKAHEEVGHVSTPSTSSYPLIGERYEGPLDEVDKQRELDSQPLRSDVSVYHSGQSEPSRNRRFKFFTWARHEGEEEVGDKDPTGYKFDHSPYEGPLDDVNKVNDLDTLPLASYVTKYHEGKTVLKEDEEEIEEPHDKQTAIIHLRSKEDEPQVEEELKPAKAPKQPKEKKPKKEKKDKDQESSFFGFLKSKDRKAHEEVGHVSTPSTSSYPLIGERYEGPLDEVDKQRELDSQPLRSDVSVYHSGQSEPSRNRRFKFFTWARHEGEEEVGDKDPTGYKFDHSPYEGPLDDVNKVNDLDTLPLASYVTKYHEGKTVLKEDEEEIEEPHDKQTAIIHLRSKEDEPQVEEELKPAKAPKQPKEKKPKKEKKDKDQESSFFGFLKSKDRKAHEEVGHVSTPSTSSYPLIGERYEGPLDEVDKQRELDSQPLRSDVSVYHSGQSEPSRNRRFKFFTWARHEGEEEVGDKDPTGYKFDHSPYEGPLDDVNKVNDLDTLPLASYVTKYHEGKTVLKEDEEEIEEPHDKQTAIIHLRSKEDEPQVEEELKPAKAPKQPKEKKPKKEKKDKDQESSFFGFLKSKDRKAHEEVGHVSTPSTSSYPLIGERYEGPLDEVDKQRELDSQPLRSDVSVYHSGQSEPSRNRRFKFFTWARHEGEEEVGDKDPTGYKFDHSPYEGPLDDVNKVNDLDTLPLASYVTKYHEGKTVLKEDEEEIEEPHDKQTAIIHLRSKEDEPQVEEELKPAKAPKQPKEKKPKKEKKDKDQESSFFGFLKSKDRKAHEEVGHVSTPSTSSYPLIGERYEGPLDEVDKQRELDSQPLRSDVSVYHSGQSEPSRNRRFKFFTWARHEGEEEVGDKDPTGYKFDHSPYEGPLDDVNKVNDLDTLPLASYVTKYHEGKTVLKEDEEEIEEPHDKQTAIIHLRSKEDEPQVEEELKPAKAPKQPKEKKPKKEKKDKDQESSFFGFLKSKDRKAHEEVGHVSTPSTSSYPLIGERYEGPLDEVDKQRELDSQPLRSDVSVYHSGQSEPSRNRRFKFFTWARHEGEEEVGDKDPTGYKFDHSPYEGPLDDVNKVNDLDTLPLASYVTKYHEGKTVLKEDEEEIEEPHDKQTAIIHLRSKEDEPQVEEELKPAKAPKQPKEKKPKKEKKDKDQESSFFGFLKSKDRKAHEEVGHVSTPSTSSYPLIGERYEGPLDEVDKQRELDSQPLRSDVSVYHSGQSEPSRNRRFKFFTWARHEGEEEVGDKDPTGYKFDHSPYEGPLDDVNKVNDLDTLPLASYVTKYHEGKTVLKEDEEEIEEPHDKQTAIIHLRSKEDEPQVEEELKPAKAPKQPKEKKPKKEKKDKDQESSFFGFLKSKDRKAHEEVGHVSTPSTSSYPLIGERYEGPLDEVDKQRELDSQPLRSDVSVYHSGQSEPSRNRRFKFFTWARHEGEEEVGDKDPTGYKFDHSPYEGPLDDVNKVNDLDTLPLASYVTKYHEGKTVLKEDEEEIEEPHDKQTAIIHLRSKEDEPQVEEELKPAKAPKQPKEKKPKKEKKDKDQESSFFGFLKSKDRKAHEEVGHVSTPSTSSYPLIGERYEGPLDEVDKQRELDSQPLRSDVSVYHSGQSEPSRNRRFKFFTWARHEGEEEVGDKDPTGYKFDHSPYEGPLDDVNKVNDLDTLPLASYVTKYHEGKTVLKEDEEEIEEPHDKQTAIIHLRSKEDEPQVEEELKPAKAPKQPKEKKPKKEKKDKDQESSFFGFLKSKDRKAHEEVGHVSTPSTSSYPLIGERYEGPLDEVDKQRELDSQPLRSDVSVYHSGQSEPSRNRRFKFFTWARHEGEEEVGDKDPTGYKFDHSPYEGPLDDVNKVNDLDTLPLASYVTKYHEGKTVLKEDEEEIEEPHDKQTAIIHLRSKEDEPQVEEELKPAKAPKQPKEKKPKKEKKDKDQESSFFGFLKSKDRKAHEEVGHVSTPSTSSYPLIGERYEGPLDEVDKQRELDSQPLRSDVSVYHSGQSEPSRNRRFKFFTWARHEGEEEVGDKDPTGYKFDHSPYEGPLDDVNKVNDLDTLPLASYVTKYHEGKTVLKEDEEEIEEPHDKQTAIIHLRSKEDEPQVEEELKPAKAPKQPKEKKPKKEKKDKDQESSFFGFLKSKDRKAHEEVGHVSTPSTSSYPLIGERYEGPLDEVDKQRELDSQPLRSDVSVYHSGQSETAREIPMLFACAMQPKGGFSRNGRLDYGFNRDSYDGPLDNMCTISDLETVPLSGFVTKYHEGESLEKGRKERRPISKPLLTTSTESDEEKGPKQTAIIHVLNGDTAVPDKLRSRTKGQMDTDRQKDYELKIRSVLRNRKPAESNYPLKEEAFDGPLEGLQTETELPTVDIFEYSSPYHHGQSSIKASHKGMAILHLKRLEDELKQPSKSVHQEAQVWDANINGTADRLGLFSLFNRKRKAEDRHWLRTLVRARRGEKSDEFSGIVFKDRSLFNKSDPITDLDIDIVLRRQFEASYEVEILLRDKKTSRFEALFSRRGPVFLPKSLLDDDNASAELRVREVGNKRSGRGVGAGEAFNSGGPQGTRGNDDSDEADESSLASQPHSSNGAAAKRYRHRRAEPTDRPQKLPMAANKATKNGTRVSLLSSLRRQISQFSSKDKKSNKSSKQVSASSSSSDSEVEVEERHAVQNEKNSGRTPTNESSMRLDGTNDQPSAGPYSPANDLDHGPVIRSERVENVYRITGAGLPPQVDPNDPSLLSTLTSCVQKNEELPRVRLIARKLEIEQQESGPMYQKASPAKSFAWPNVRELRRYFSHMKVIDGASSLSRRLRRSHRSVYKCESETAPPHTTLQSWHETETSPEQIVTEIDEHGNVIKKTIKTSHETHTIQKQTYQTFSVGNDANEPNGTSNSIENALETIQSINSSIPTAASHAQTRVLVYGKDGEQLETSDVQYDENQVVSSKVVTTGNRTIETITYKTVKDGVVSTNVEHRVTIQGPEVDHEAELRKAIIEATGLNPRYEVQRVEVKQERLA
ncbi:unnamed protein product [Bursaphelenchus xylophilus]|uniref:(pine wood nematode) hypothetical protein n=1 Tax=Bursaphelenchus xylophilus TaxID=6326 RepID=A0A811JZA2_BURXY|nr:unnamed protein product [Bursaphelenchus xylophilus]CAG9083388.1 unnamed protein product [Bursaphelenchus xylophilus]